MSENTGGTPARTVREAYAFACLSCGHGWERSFDIEHHVDGDGRPFVTYVAEGARVPSPLTRPDCGNCGSRVLRIMRSGTVTSAANPPCPAGPPVPGVPRAGTTPAGTAPDGTRAVSPPPDGALSGGARAAGAAGGTGSPGGGAAGGRTAAAGRTARDRRQGRLAGRPGSAGEGAPPPVRRRHWHLPGLFRPARLRRHEEQGHPGRA
ncbi:hypothetical protein [Streptomyces zingiberis]|uniref:hypothetical protein n=1 Tax=Streptomyces zingiberis TaxID=2053010 RepID=UPI00289313F0|nr:hypothetical protein [Streptomyces zingiberis]